MWKTLREFCCNWRHHFSLIDQWNQMMYSITYRVVYHLYGSKHLSLMAPLPAQDPDFFNLLKEMPQDAVMQSWFRMLHTLGNPLDLLYPDIITSTPGFRDSAAETSQISACVVLLPNIFHSVMKGVAAQVCLFLGQKLPKLERHSSFISRTDSHYSTGASPISRRKDNASRSQFYLPSPNQQSSLKQKESFYMNINPDRKSPPLLGTEQYTTQEGIIGKPTGKKKKTNFC